MAEGYDESAAEMAAQKYNIAAIIIFAISRFVCTWLLNFFSPGRFLAVMGIVAATAIGGVMLFTDRSGLYCLVAVSGCMSMMFSTIYGITLRGLGKHIKLASAGLTMSVSGGAVFTALQAGIIESDFSLFGLSSVNLSFVIPLICFIMVALFGHRAYVREHILHSYE
jgi:FHS family L-fucose permease-like MFS transporter